MAGVKTWVNLSPATLQVSLFVRQGVQPTDQDGTVAFTLDPGQTLDVPYGNEQNSLLNGISLFTIFQNDLYSKVQFVTARESELDNLLNLNDVLTISKELSDYILSGSSSLDAVNDAQTVAEMRAAIEDPQLGLDLTEYNPLSETLKDQVAGLLLMGRPAGGYLTAVEVQEALDAAINQIVNPDQIFVQADATGGNGSRAHPFGTIAEGIAAANPGGTVQILSGTYSITSQIAVNKPGITLKGQDGALLVLQADLIPLLIQSDHATIDGLTMTSDVPYRREFIQVGGASARLVNNTIYGPPQALPMSDWVVNRAVVPQVGNADLSVENNTFHTLRTGMYINPNVTGIINDNVVYNTKGGFLVDRAFTTFDGNGWGTPRNEFDIVLLAGTTTGPPYDDLTALSANNHQAVISDQRESGQ